MILTESVCTGRWTTLRFDLNLEQQRPAYNTIKEALCDYNVIFSQPDTFELKSRQDRLFWDRIGANVENDAHNHSTSQSGLSWPIRYQLDVCISQSVLLEENITAEFISALQKMPEREAIKRLEYAAAKKDRLFEPSSLLALYVPFRTSVKIPQHCILSRSATVTPSTIYLSSPAVEMSNRILRQYKEHADRFLRVRFTDEKHEGRINSLDDESHNSVFTRIYHCLTNGITVGGRRYEFLAMGNSQFREHGAYFFASAPGIMTAAEIRSKMGEFGHIRVVAKWASRLGQCFSTTRAIRGTKVKIVEIRDVKRNGFNFTDGVGKISPHIASVIASEIGIKSKSGEPPSVFQIRLGGIKGVLAVAPEAKNNEVHIRPSQYKFPALYEGLEVIRYSSYTSVVLNRQLITVLTAMGVKSRVFEEKMAQELRELELAMTDSKVALEKLQHRIDFNQMTLTLANAVTDGFLDTNEPFTLSCMRLWRVWYHKSLKEKAGLTILEGAFVLGCVDETGSLRGHEEQHIDELMTRAEKIAALPQIFIQIDPLGTGVSQVVTGVCLVARNPSLHPGDIRVVHAVDVPALHHLRDVVVFSQQGIRDVPSMCSGGDLDGDDFVVIWDENLIPPESSWDIPAMDFEGPEPIQVNRDVQIGDVVPFFVTYMKTDKLRSIATSHLANADWLQDGIRNPRCLELAELHSIAVDYPKSGVPATMRQDLRPYKYPHFMPSRWRAADRIYHSTTVLGKLYDKVTPLKFEPLIHLPFDARILAAATSASTATLEAARTLKAEYDDALRRIMAQHDIATEFEVWTTFVLDHARITNEYSFHEELGRLASVLRDRYQEAALETVRQSLPESAEMQRNGPEVHAFIAAMYRITSEEVQIWTRKQQEHEIKGTEQPPLISFPWLFQRELGKLAGTRDAGREMDVTSTTLDVVTPEVAREAVRRTATPAAAAALDDPMLIDFTSAGPVSVATAAPASREHDDIETATGNVMHRGDLLELFQGMELDSPALTPTLTPSSVQSKDQAQWQEEAQQQAEISSAKVKKRRDSGASAGAGTGAAERPEGEDKLESGEIVIMCDDDDEEDQELNAFEKLQHMLG